MTKQCRVCKQDYEPTPSDIANYDWKCKSCHALDARNRYAPLPRTTRRDVLPEGLEYQDTGCKVHPSCLDCPLPACVYDSPDGLVEKHRLDKWKRDQRIFQLRKQGVPAHEIGRAFKVSRRTVQRAIQTAGRPKPQGVDLSDVPGKPVSEITHGFKARKPSLGLHGSR